MVKTIVSPAAALEAVSLKKSMERSFFLAGGTFLNAGRKPQDLNFISLHRLDLKTIAVKEGALHLGAMVTLGELSDPPDLEHKGFRALRESCRAISRNIRNMATLGGTVAARYSRSDITPVLLAAGASLTLMDESGEKTASLEEYHALRDRGQSPLILEIIIPLPHPGSRLTAARFARTSLDLPIVKVALNITSRDGVTASVRAACGGLTQYVQRLPEIEQYINDKNLKHFSDELKPGVEDLLGKHLQVADDLQGSGAFKMSVLLALIEDCIKESL